MKLKTILLQVLYLLLLGMWSYAAFSKALEFNTFNYQLKKSPLFETIYPAVAVAVIAAELMIVAMLLIAKTRRTAYILSASLLTTFTIYLAGILAFSSEIPCSCGGLISTLSWGQHIIFNIGFIVVSLLGIMLTPKRNTENFPHQRIPVV